MGSIADTPARSIQVTGEKKRARRIARKFSSFTDVENFTKYSGNVNNHSRLSVFRVNAFRNTKHPFLKDGFGKKYLNIPYGCINTTIFKE